MHLDDRTEKVYDEALKFVSQKQKEITVIYQAAQDYCVEQAANFANKTTQQNNVKVATEMIHFAIAYIRAADLFRSRKKKLTLG